MQTLTNAHLRWQCLYNLRLWVLIKHPFHASFPLITSCWVNWIIKDLIKPLFGSQSSNTVKPCTQSISNRDQIGRGWYTEQEFRDVSSIMHWNGKVWSGLSIWSLNPPVPLHRVGLLFFCLPIIYCRFQCNPLRYEIISVCIIPLDCSPHHYQFVIQYILLTSWEAALTVNWLCCYGLK